MSRRRVRVAAPAKVNLFLRVLHRRPDGFRELETLFQTVSLADRVEVEWDPAGSSEIGLHVEGPEGAPGPDLGPAEENLVVRAARAYREAKGLTGSLALRLTKRIPAGAGLGGGSSDAAAVLAGLAALTGEGEPAWLREIGAGLGSDVAFFLAGSPLALGRGRGERLTPLPPLPVAHLVLGLPPVHVSTADAYRRLGALREAAGEEPGSPRSDEALTAGSWDRVGELAENDFQAPVSERFPEVAATLEGLREAGARLALLSGSGGASFGVFDDPRGAERAAVELEGRFGWPFLAVRSCTGVPVPEVGN